MRWQQPLTLSGLMVGLALAAGCADNNSDLGVVPTAPPQPTPTITPTPPPPTPSPTPAGPTNVEEALAIPDDEYDYAAVFDDSGRGVSTPAR
ncbi:MAG: hypothetical protein ABF296_05725 [Oceanococcaceae bacterium]